jgi:hypothetical protein
MISNQYPTIIYGISGGTLVPLGSLVFNANGQLILTPSASSGGGGGTTSLQVWDSTAGKYRPLTAPGGVLTLGPTE